MLNKKFWGVAIIAAVLTSCGSDPASKDIAEVSEAMPVQLENGDNWSLVKKDGNFLYEDEFENEPSAVVEGVFSVKEGDGYTLYRAEDKPVLIDGCDGLVSVGVMSEGMIPLSKADSRITVADSKGLPLFELSPVGKHEIVEAHIKYENDRLGFKTAENKWGFVDRKGDVVIKPAYESIDAFSEGLAVVTKEGTTMVIDKNGDTAFKFKKNWTAHTTNFQEGYIIVVDGNQRFFFVDKEGETIKCSSKVKSITGYHDGYFVFEEDGNYGVMTIKEQKVIVRAKYNRVVILPDDQFLCVEKDGESDILSTEGDRIVSMDDYEDGVNYSPFFGFYGRDNDMYVMIDDNGKAIKNKEYYQLGKGISCKTVTSAFFNAEPILKAITNVAKPAGFGKFKYGNAPSTMLTGAPNDYAYTSSATVPDGSGSDYKCTYSTTAMFEKQIASYNFDYYSYSGSYSFTPDNKLVSLVLSINVENAISKATFDKIVNALVAMGYKIGASKYENGNGRAILRSANGVTASVETHSYGSSGQVYVTTSGSMSDFDYDTQVSIINKTERPDADKYKKNEAPEEEVSAPAPIDGYDESDDYVENTTSAATKAVSTAASNAVKQVAQATTSATQTAKTAAKTATQTAKTTANTQATQAKKTVKKSSGNPILDAL